MYKKKSIQIKAAFLLVVFVFNIVVGFACGLGIDMGFNAGGLEKRKSNSKIHTHADGKKHQHGAEKTKHNHSDKNHHEEGSCCTDGVVKLAQADKAVPAGTALAHSVFSADIIHNFQPVNLSYHSQATVSIKYFVRGHHPPIPDIRIAIQSFQI